MRRNLLKKKREKEPKLAANYQENNLLYVLGYYGAKFIRPVPARTLNRRTRPYLEEGRVRLSQPNWLSFARYSHEEITTRKTFFFRKKFLKESQRDNIF